MPKVQRNQNEVLRSYVKEFDAFTTDGSVLFCKYCEAPVTASKKFQVQQHLKTSKHIRFEAKSNSAQKEQQLLLACSSKSGPDRSQFNADLCKAFVSADIPLHKLNNKCLKSFLEQYTGKKVPDESTLRTQRMAKRQLEVCVDSLDSAIAAVNGGADRLELCAALSEGGLTPSPGLLFAVRKHINKLVDVFCIVRPRAGPMVYSEGEAEIILHDAATLKKAGADGLVFGALTVNGTIDRKLCKSFREVASDLPCTFHRAFDLLQDPLSELETVIELGYQRILTSGGKATALEGCDTLAQLVTAARGRIVIMVGAGVKSDNVGNIISLTGVSQCHASARVCRVFGSEETNGAKMGSESDNVLWVACQDEVRALKKAIGEN